MYSETSKEYVILLHGLLRNKGSMKKMQRALEEGGYKVINHDYPSSKANVKTLALEEIPKALSLCDNASSIHFITHSMGGILLRAYLDEHSIEKLGHVVMLGPPNQGSEIVDKIGKAPGFRALNGPAGLDLGTMGVAQRFKPIDFTLGVIAGTRTIDILGYLMLPRPNDGKVSVESTKIEGMKEHLIMKVTHTFMMQNANVIKQSIHFLKEGRFHHG